MKVTTSGGPCGGRTYDLPAPLPGGLTIVTDDRQRAHYRLDWQPAPRGQHTPIYRHERTD